MNSKGARQDRSTHLAATCAVVMVLAVGIIWAGVALPRELDHDEHQFVASGVMLARSGLLPYLDYPYFHLPNLIFVFAAADLVAASPFMAARCISLGFALIGLCAVFWLVWSELEEASRWLRLGMAGSAVMLAAFSPLCFYTVGRAWNHDAATALLLLALVLSRAARGRPGPAPLIAAGLAAGLAVGTRLSMAPVAIGLALVLPMWMKRESLGRRLQALALYAAGGAIGLLPTLVLAAIDMRAFVFGNFGYAALNTAFRQASGYTSAMDLPGKARFFFEQVLREPRGAILFGSFAVFLVADGLRVIFSRGEGRRLPLVIGLLFPFLAWGALAPTPSWYQYFYVLVPFAAVATVVSAARVRLGERRLPFGAAWAIVAALAVGWFSRSEVSSARALVRPDAWVPQAAREVGSRVAQLTEEGPVLTLSPIYALEGGRPIYAQFTSGPFAWRVSSFVPADSRAALHIVSPEELEGVLTASPPAGILVGREVELEAGFVAYANAHDYRPLDVGEGLTLWVR